MMGLAATLGPILGGWLVGADLFGLSWRAIFLVNVPVGIAALVFGSKVLPRTSTPRAPSPSWTWSACCWPRPAS